MRTQVSEHEKLFDEICGKLNELSIKNDFHEEQHWSEKIETMQYSLKKSQDELIQAQMEIQEKIRGLDDLGAPGSDLGEELNRMTHQLEQERTNNSKLSTDLAKSLEFNLKLQFDIEEMRTKASQIVNEERSHNQYLTEKINTLSNDLEISKSVINQLHSDFNQTKENYQNEFQTCNQIKSSLEENLKIVQENLEQKFQEISYANDLISKKNEEIKKISESLMEFESHTQQQNEVMKTLTSVAEKKIIELKMAFDKKSVECQDYYSHLQKALTQINILGQENITLKEYVSKLTSLHQRQTQAPHNIGLEAQL